MSELPALADLPTQPLPPAPVVAQRQRPARSPVRQQPGVAFLSLAMVVNASWGLSIGLALGGEPSALAGMIASGVLTMILVLSALPAMVANRRYR